ncbi:Re/Si-specific NAD(P)(+) transhydrogenase subunit alpha [Aciditerrimonas ferrireducens]|uniref:Re/Si-specific NAD(P)(+) transhydrogenase subunit alpha n=1 Tax=Aciditerrimonas ferrireducens TaxID=667306 RepID=UPI002006A14C|nr:Re/Si-specific NAD(P)(+) transhydrogenase subunit alpha [Aciditerrimonas ferrireducens]MCK4176373.1 Re/Si-specific NAD(P)(+) transhydrogenase subunit alpha [Aciditerrimonas ferrireducens]
MKLAVPTETRPGERRVAMVPEVVGRLPGVEVAVQAGAGRAAHFGDDAYQERGASVVGDLAALLEGAEVVAKVQPPTPEELASWPEGLTLVSFLAPLAQPEVVQALADRRATVFSLDLLPRISRAQAMDALSSQATVAGYRAALAAAELLPKFFPLLMTAAGTVPPAKVLVIGAGVAGLQAIATARRLGAQVRAYDVRAAAKEEVQSLGATFVELPLETQEGAGGYARAQSEEFLTRQRELLAKEVAAADVVLTTAAVPGRRAPVLVTRSMVEQMAPGSVVVDLAADSGGNCEVTQAGQDVEVGEVVVRGLSNPPSGMPTHASFLYARNVANFLALLVRDGQLAPDFDDEIVNSTCVVRQGEVLHGPTREALGLPPLAPLADPVTDSAGTAPPTEPSSPTKEATS